jgi:hypothetical protein
MLRCWYRKVFRLLPGLAATALAVACQTTVTRVQNGTAVSGRAIAPKAYAAYLRGRLLEHDGQTQAAEAEYLTTLAYDSKASDAYVRLGVIRCGKNSRTSDQAFAKAEALAPNDVMLWQERAHCALKTGKLTVALETGRRALELAPDDPQNSYLLALALNRSNQTARARDLAWAMVSAFPRDRRGWELLDSFYSAPAQYRQALLTEAFIRTRQTSSTSRYRLAAGLSAEYAHKANAQSSRANEIAQASSRLVSALYVGDEKAASIAARELRLTSLKLALQAYELGAYEIAYNEALRATRVAPDNANAWALALVLSDVLDKSDTLTELLERKPSLPTVFEPRVEGALKQMAERQSQSNTP